MNWIAHSETPFINAQRSVIDVSGLSDQFRDGQKLRQEYEARQQQKALNEIMKVGDHNGRLELAQKHKYAGALVPMLQQYDEARQKSALDNLKTSADIGKVYGETSKLGAESGKIGAETTGLVRENTANIQNDISALAVTQNPQLFALGLGEMTKQGLISPERTDMMLKMITTDPQNAAKVMQSMVMANPELAKLFQPKSEVLDAKDGAYMYSVNPFTGEANEPSAKINYGVSPDNVLDNETSRMNNQNTVAGSMYNSDNSYNASVYGANIASQDRQLKLNQDGEIEWFKAETARQSSNTDRVKAETAMQREQKARAKMPIAVQNKFLDSKNKARGAYRQYKEVSKWEDEIKSGNFQLSGFRNAGNRVSAAAGINAGDAAKYTEFTSFISAFVNEKLANASGVQTDQDEIRFWKEVTGTGGVPRTNAQALAMLQRLKKYSLNEQKTYYNDMREVGNQYGANIPEYGKNKDGSGARSGASAAPKSKGASIIGGILGGG